MARTLRASLPLRVAWHWTDTPRPDPGCDLWIDAGRPNLLGILDPALGVGRSNRPGRATQHAHEMCRLCDHGHISADRHGREQGWAGSPVHGEIGSVGGAARAEVRR